MKYILGILLLTTTAFAGGVRRIDADQIRNSAGTSVYSFPASTDTLAGIAAAQIFTNKTIDGANNTLTVRLGSGDVTGSLAIANGGTNNASLGVTAGGVLYTDGVRIQNVGVGSGGQVLTSAGTSTPVWSAVSVTNAYAAKTTTYAISASADNTIAYSATGGAFTTTLPTSVGNQGKDFVLCRTDQTLANQITVATTSSQTIGPFGTSVTMATQGECWWLRSDNANWLVLHHHVPTIRTSYTATSTNVTTASEGTYWWRLGAFLCADSTSAVSGTAAAAASFALPSGLTIDATNISTTTNSNGFGHFYNLTAAGSYAGTANGPWVVFTDTSVSSTVVYIAKTNSGSRFAKANGDAISTSGDRLRWSFCGIPITGWK